MTLDLFTISLLNGISYGLLLFMLSSGLTLIFGMMGVLNFAHASFYMLGAYFGYTLSKVIGFWFAFFLAPVIVGFIGIIFEIYCMRRIHRFGHVPELLATFGLSYLVLVFVQFVWGLAAVPYGLPEQLRGPLFTLFGTQFPKARAFVMLVSVAMLIAIWLLLTRTRVGLIIQASLSHPETVGALGHNVPRVFLIVFGGGAGLAGLAGVIGGNTYITEPAMAASVGPIIFVIVVVGGLGSLVGAFLASLLIGIMQTLAVALDYSFANVLEIIGIAGGAQLPGGSIIGLTLAQLAPALPYLLMILILMLRPSGLLGKREG